MNQLLVIALVVVAGCLSVNGDVTGSNPSNGACLCISGSSVNVRATGMKLFISSLFYKATVCKCINYYIFSTLICPVMCTNSVRFSDWIG